MPVVPMSRYSVWCKSLLHSHLQSDASYSTTDASCNILHIRFTGEYTKPCGYYKFQKKGVYSSLEEAQIALKFALNGGDYTHMVMEGKDLNPAITGKPRKCDQIQFCYGYNDDPLRLYIWAKTEAGELILVSLLHRVSV